jgi:hypothetical protein
VQLGSYAAMQRALDMEAVFPINDRASAALMAMKADCLHKAGIISEREKQWVECRVRTFSDDATLEDAVLRLRLALSCQSTSPPWPQNKTIKRPSRRLFSTTPGPFDEPR